MTGPGAPSDRRADPREWGRGVDAAAAARTAEARGEGTQSFESFPDTAEEAYARGGQYGLEGFEYYCTPRGQHPRSGKSMPWSSLDRMTSFDSLAPKDLHWIEGASHVDLYDREEFVAPALTRLNEFFETTLTEAADRVAAEGMS